MAYVQSSVMQFRVKPWRGTKHEITAENLVYTQTY